jgi:hypothetical protein
MQFFGRVFYFCMGGVFLCRGGGVGLAGFIYICFGFLEVVADVPLSVKAREESQFTVRGPGDGWVLAPRLLRLEHR